MAETQAGQAELKQAIWEYAGKSVLWLTLILGGFLLGWLMWGDAPQLREKVREEEQKVHAARAERENATYEISRLQRDNERLNRELQQLKSAAAPPQ